MTLKNLRIDKTWSLFLDRDGVINKKLPGDYVKNWQEFEFISGVPEAIHILNGIFSKLFIVTNQQGIGKGIMTEIDLEVLHNKLHEELRYEGGKITKIYHSPYRDEEKSVFRKPNIGMAKKAKIDFPDVDFQKSIMVGDSVSDMQFGKNAGMYTVYITNSASDAAEYQDIIDYVFHDLENFVKAIND